MKTHDDMIATWKKDSTFCTEYDALEETFTFFDALVSARHQARLTQAEVAETCAQRRQQWHGWRRAVGVSIMPPPSRRCASMPLQWDAVWRSNLFPYLPPLGKNEVRWNNPENHLVT